MLSRCFWELSVDVGAFVIGLSQISFFFSCTDSAERSFLVSLLVVLIPDINDLEDYGQGHKASLSK